MNNNKYKEKEYHTAVRTVIKSNQKIVEAKINTPNTHRTIDSLWWTKLCLYINNGVYNLDNTWQ